MEKNFVLANQEKIKYLGRSRFNDGSLELTWSNSGFEFEFRGCAFSLLFDSYSGDDQPAYIKVTVDGASQRFAISDGREAVIAEDLGDGCHHARVIRVTEGSVPVSIRNLRLIGKNPDLLDRPEDKKIKLEFIGDSLTCGYGILGDETCGAFYTYEEDSSSAFAYLVAQSLNADANFLCVSGKGMVNDCAGGRDYEVPLWYNYETRNGGEWNHSSFEPDCIVINIGTNDAWGGVSVDEFKSVSLAFLAELRKKHPNAAILWAFGFVGTGLIPTVREVVKEFSKTDKRVYFYEIPSIFGKKGETGGAGHPSVKANKRLARSIERVIRKILKV